jgi:hypothetical protein
MRALPAPSKRRDALSLASLPLPAALLTLVTVPLLPLPSSLRCLRSSFFRSSLYSMPSSRLASCSDSLLW